jgi:energy-coupling factor transporter transmembrane protein EcfT
MGVGLLFGLILLLILFVLALLLLFYAKKKKSKIGLLMSSLLLLVIIAVFMTNNIDEWTISKKDVIKDLKNLKIELKDEFEIADNTVTGMPERFQVTELKISKTDKERIIQIIKNSDNYKEYKNDTELQNDTNNEQFGFSEQIFNFKYPEFYSRETYCKVDNFPTRFFISVYDNENIIKYERIEQ